MKVKEVHKKYDEGIVTFDLDTGEWGNWQMSMTLAEYEETPFVKGQVLTDEEEDYLWYRDMYVRARKKALSLLAAAPQSERALASKIYGICVLPEIAKEVAHEMVEKGYVDERRQLEPMVLNRANRSLYGPRKIVHYLCSRGYTKDDVVKVMNSLVECGEIDFDLNRARLIESKLGKEPSEEEIKKLLYKYGFIK